MQIAIITGASSGLGRAYVKALEEEALDEIWVIARRRELLEKLAEETTTPLRILPLDLTDMASIHTLDEELKKNHPIVKYLINAAGFGLTGRTCDMELSSICDMLDLNCRAAVAVTQISLPHIPPTGRILEICSCSAFHPMPFLNIYAASKIFLLNYTQALHEELLAQDIHVTAVCPYWIRDTEFIQKATGKEYSAGFDHFPFAQHTEDVVLRSLKGVKNNVAVITPGIVPCLHHIISTLLPNSLLMLLARLFQKR